LTPLGSTAKLPNYPHADQGGPSTDCRCSRRLPSTLREVLESAYAPIIGDLNVSATTPMKLEEAFKQAGVKAGQMLAKSLRFYLKGLNQAGVNLPAHLTKVRSPKSSSPGGAAKKASSPKPDPANSKMAKTAKDGEPKAPGKRRNEIDPSKQPQDGFARQEIPTIEGAYIQYPIDMSEADLGLFHAALEFIPGPDPERPMIDEDPAEALRRLLRVPPIPPKPEGADEPET